MKYSSVDSRHAISIGRKAELSLRRTIESLQMAHGMGRADLWFDFLGADLIKYYHLFRARRQGKEAQRLIRRFQKSLGDLSMGPEQAGLDRAQDTEFRFESGVVLADLFEDFLGDIWMQGRIETRRRKANIALVRVRGVLRVLKGRSAGDQCLG